MIFTVYTLYGDVNRTAKKKLTHAMPYCFFFATWFFLSLLAVLVGSFIINLASPWQGIILLLINLSGVIPLLPLQKTINAINEREGLKAYIDNRFSLKTLLAMLFGLLFWTLSIESTLIVSRVINNPGTLTNILPGNTVPLNLGVDNDNS